MPTNTEMIPAGIAPTPPVRPVSVVNITIPTTTPTRRAKSINPNCSARYTPKLFAVRTEMVFPTEAGEVIIPPKLSIPTNAAMMT